MKDDVWARAAADRSGTTVLVGLAVVAVAVVVHVLVREPAADALSGLTSGGRALVGLAVAVVLWTPVLVWLVRARGATPPVPLWLKGWGGLVLLLSFPAWLPGRTPSAAQDATTDQLGWALGVLVIAFLVLLPVVLCVLGRRLLRSGPVRPPLVPPRDS